MEGRRETRKDEWFGETRCQTRQLAEPLREATGRLQYLADFAGYEAAQELSSRGYLAILRR